MDKVLFAGIYFDSIGLVMALSFVGAILGGIWYFIKDNSKIFVICGKVFGVSTALFILGTFFLPSLEEREAIREDQKMDEKLEICTNEAFQTGFKMGITDASQLASTASNVCMEYAYTTNRKNEICKKLCGTTDLLDSCCSEQLFNFKTNIENQYFYPGAVKFLMKNQ